MSYLNLDQCTSATATTGPECAHKNGWFHTVTFWIFTKKVFACFDCGDLVQGEAMKKLLSAREGKG